MGRVQPVDLVVQTAREEVGDSVAADLAVEEGDLGLEVVLEALVEAAE